MGWDSRVPTWCGSFAGPRSRNLPPMIPAIGRSQQLRLRRLPHPLPFAAELATGVYRALLAFIQGGTHSTHPLPH